MRTRISLPSLDSELGRMRNNPVQPDLRTSHSRIDQHEHPASVFHTSLCQLIGMYYPWSLDRISSDRCYLLNSGEKLSEWFQRSDLQGRQAVAASIRINPQIMLASKSGAVCGSWLFICPLRFAGMPPTLRE